MRGNGQLSSKAWLIRHLTHWHPPRTFPRVRLTEGGRAIAAMRSKNDVVGLRTRLELNHAKGARAWVSSVIPIALSPKLVGREPLLRATEWHCDGLMLGLRHF